MNRSNGFTPLQRGVHKLRAHLLVTFDDQWTQEVGKLFESPSSILSTIREIVTQVMKADIGNQLLPQDT